MQFEPTDLRFILCLWNISLYTILLRKKHQLTWFKPHWLKVSDGLLLFVILHIQA